MIEAPVRTTLVDRLKHVLRHTPGWDLARKHAACEDLLLAEGVTWRDVLTSTVNVEDAEPIRHAAFCANIIFELRHLAGPIWLPGAAVWKVEAEHDQRALESLVHLSIRLIERSTA